MTCFAPYLDPFSLLQAKYHHTHKHTVLNSNAKTLNQKYLWRKQRESLDEWRHYRSSRSWQRNAGWLRAPPGAPERAHWFNSRVRRQPYACCSHEAPAAAVKRSHCQLQRKLLLMIRNRETAEICWSFRVVTSWRICLSLPLTKTKKDNNSDKTRLVIMIVARLETRLKFCVQWRSCMAVELGWGMNRVCLDRFGLGLDTGTCWGKLGDPCFLLFLSNLPNFAVGDSITYYLSLSHSLSLCVSFINGITDILTSVLKYLYLIFAFRPSRFYCSASNF